MLNMYFFAPLLEDCVNFSLKFLCRRMNPITRIALCASPRSNILLYVPDVVGCIFENEIGQIVSGSGLLLEQLRPAAFASIDVEKFSTPMEALVHGRSAGTTSRTHRSRQQVKNTWDARPLGP